MSISFLKIAKAKIKSIYIFGLTINSNSGKNVDSLQCKTLLTVDEWNSRRNLLSGIKQQELGMDGKKLVKLISIS